MYIAHDHSYTLLIRIVASRDRFLLRGTSSISKHIGLFGKCGSSAQRQLDVCRDYGKRYEHLHQCVFELLIL